MKDLNSIVRRDMRKRVSTFYLANRAAHINETHRDNPSYFTLLAFSRRSKVASLFLTRTHERRLSFNFSVFSAHA